MRSVSGPVVLVVLDGWGWREDAKDNGIAMAKTPIFDSLVSAYPFTLLNASGEAVGLPAGQIGNSEVGHTAIGAGKVIYQDLIRIGKDLERGAEHNRAFAQAFAHVTNRNSTLHLIGILSPGGVHGHEDHVMELVRASRRVGVEKIVVHPFLDGRDTPRTSGIESLRKLEDFCENNGCVIGSVMGRYWAMDRDTNWDRTDQAFLALTAGQAKHVYSDEALPSEIVQEQYHGEMFDEHMEPLVFGNHTISKGDAVIFTNFRRDRAVQLSERIGKIISESDLCFVTMTDYGLSFKAIVAYTPEEKGTTLGEAVAKAGMKQVHIAETEKFPHATYFLNGGAEGGFEGEEDVLVPSRKDVKTHDEAPEMRAHEICEEAITRLGGCDFMFINFANPDMVGHTANQPAIIRAVEFVDTELGRLVEAVQSHNGALVIIADHGNAEVMVDPVTGEPHTAHTINPVPCIVVSPLTGLQLRRDEPGLVDVAPTVLDLLGIGATESMTGTSLLTR